MEPPLEICRDFHNDEYPSSQNVCPDTIVGTVCSLWLVEPSADAAPGIGMAGASLGSLKDVIRTWSLPAEDRHVFRIG